MTHAWSIPVASIPLAVGPTPAAFRASIAELHAWLCSPDGRRAQHSTAEGRAANLLPDDHAAVEVLSRQLAAWLDAPAECTVEWRYRHYAVGQGHPPHLDAYDENGRTLVTTFLAYLADVPVGGQTAFVPEDDELRVCIAPRANTAALWHVVQGDGTPEPRTRHEAFAVGAGAKEVLAGFVYAPVTTRWLPDLTQLSAGDGAEELPAVRVDRAPTPIVPLPDGRDPEDIPGVFCIQDTAPRDTITAFRTAALLRDIPFFELRATDVRIWEPVALPDHSLLLAPSTTARAQRVLEHLWRPGLASLYASAWGPWQSVGPQWRALQAAGLPIPRTLPVVGTHREALDASVAALGGFPVILRFDGGSGGEGIVWIDSAAGLYSVLDHAVGRGDLPELVECIADATHWRVAVVDGAVAGWCRSVTPERDFRSASSDDPADYRVPLPEAVAAVAVRAPAAVGLRAAGVDVLTTPDGRVVVLEANFPFYFGHLQQHGHDVAGALIEALARPDQGRRSG